MAHRKDVEWPGVGRVLLAGCSSSSRATSSTSSTDAPTTSSSSSTTADPSGLTDADMAELLLTIHDMPIGWTVDDSPTTDPGDTEPDCLGAAETIAGGGASASVSFTSTDTGEFFSEHLTNVTKSPRRTFNQLVDALDACSEVTFRSDGTEFTGTMEPISFYEYGDDSAAWQMSFPMDGGTLDYDLVLVRYDHIIALYGFAGADPIDEATVDDLILGAEDVLFHALDPNGDPGADPGTGTDPADPGTDPGADPSAGSGDSQTA